MGSSVALQLVSHQLPRSASLPLQELAEEPFGRTGVAISLNQDLDDITVLVHGPPQVVPFAPDPHEDFVYLPHVTQPTLATLQLSGVLRSELPTPLPDGLMGDGDSPLRQQILHVAETQGKPVVQPNAVADDLTREPVAAMAVGMCIDPQSLQ